MHNTACEKRPSVFDAFLPTRGAQTATLSLPVKKIHLNTMSLLSDDLTEKRHAFSACAQSGPKHAVLAIRKHCSLRKRAALFARGAEQASLTSIPTDSRRLETHGRILPSSYNFGLTSKGLRTKSEVSAVLMKVTKSRPPFQGLALQVRESGLSNAVMRADGRKMQPVRNLF